MTGGVKLEMAGCSGNRGQVDNEPVSSTRPVRRSDCNLGQHPAFLNIRSLSGTEATQSRED